MLANATLWSIEPIAAPTIKVAATVIPKVTAFGCFVKTFRILLMIDIVLIYTAFMYKSIIIYDGFIEKSF